MPRVDWLQIDSAHIRISLRAQRGDEMATDKSPGACDDCKLTCHWFLLIKRVPCAYFVTTKLPIASASILVRVSTAMASPGVHTIGSFSLKLVFRTTGTPVRS